MVQNIPPSHINNNTFFPSQHNLVGSVSRILVFQLTNVTIQKHNVQAQLVSCLLCVTSRFINTVKKYNPCTLS